MEENNENRANTIDSNGNRVSGPLLRDNFPQNSNVQGGGDHNGLGNKPTEQSNAAVGVSSSADAINQLNVSNTNGERNISNSNVNPDLNNSINNIDKIKNKDSEKQDLEGNDQVNQKSSGSGFWDKIKDNKKIIIIALIVLFALAVLFIILYFTVFKGNYQPQVFYRNFAKNQKHNYIKKVSTCIENYNVEKDSVECNYVDANMTFYISNVTDGRTYFKPKDQNDEKEDELLFKYDFNMITALLHFSHLTYKNSTGTVTFKGYNFDNILKEGEKIDDEDFENNGPVIMTEMFDNGTLYRIHKPKAVSNITWEYMVEAIKEFSPDLAEYLYDEQHESNNMVLKNNFNERIKMRALHDYNKQKNIAIPEEEILLYQNLINSPDVTEDSFHYEKPGLQGQGHAIPKYSNNNTDDDGKIHKVKRTINKDSYVDIDFPKNSFHEVEQNAFLNKSSGNLDSVIASSKSELNSDNKPNRKNENADHFNDNEYRENSDFTYENVLSGNDYGQMKLNSTTEMILMEFDPEDKNKTEMFYEIYKKHEKNGEYKIMDVYKERKDLNMTKLEEDKAWQHKVDFALNRDQIDPEDDDSSQKRVLMGLNSIDNDLDKLKEKTFEILYPIYQGNIFGFSSSLTSNIRLDPKENKMFIKLTLTISGLGNLELIARDLPVNIDGAIDGLVKFIKKALHTLDELIDYLNLDGKFDLLKKLEKFFSKIGEHVHFPFDIENVYFTNIMEKLGEVINNVVDFVKTTLEWFKKEKFAWKNPLIDLWETFKEFSKKYGIDYLNEYTKIIQDEFNQFNHNFTDISSLYDSKEVVRVFEDMLDDTFYFKNSITDIYKTIKDKIYHRMMEDTEDYTQFLKEEAESIYNLLRATTQSILDKSQYTVSLGNVFDEFTSIVTGSLDDMIRWVGDSNNYVDMICLKDVDLTTIFDKVKALGENIISDSSNLITDIDAKIRKKIDEFDDIKPFEALYKEFKEIYNFFYNFKFNHFGDYIKHTSVDFLGEFAQERLDTYYTQFYKNVYEVQEPLEVKIKEYKSKIEAKANVIIRNIEKNNKIVNNFVKEDLEYIVKEFTNMTDFHRIKTDDKMKVLNSNVISFINFYKKNIKQDAIKSMDDLILFFEKQMKLAPEPYIVVDTTEFPGFIDPEKDVFLKAITNFFGDNIEGSMSKAINTGINTIKAQFIDIETITAKFNKTKDTLNPVFIELFLSSFDHLTPAQLLDYNTLKESFTSSLGDVQKEAFKSIFNLVNEVYSTEMFNEYRKKFKDRMLAALTLKVRDPATVTISPDKLNYNVAIKRNDTCIQTVLIPTNNSTKSCSIFNVPKAIIDALPCGTPQAQPNYTCVFHQEFSEHETNFASVSAAVLKPELSQDIANFLFRKIKVFINNSIEQYDSNVKLITDLCNDLKQDVAGIIVDFKDLLFKSVNDIYRFEVTYDRDFFDTSIEQFQKSMLETITGEMNSFVGNYKELFTKIKAFAEKIMDGTDSVLRFMDEDEKKQKEKEKIGFIPDFIARNIEEVISAYKKEIEESASTNDDDKSADFPYNNIMKTFSKKLYEEFSLNIELIIQNLNNNLQYFTGRFVSDALFYLPKNLESTVMEVKAVLEEKIKDILVERPKRKEQKKETAKTEMVIDYNLLKTTLKEVSGIVSEIENFVKTNRQSKEKTKIIDYFEFNAYEKGKELRNLTDYIFGFDHEVKAYMHRVSSKPHKRKVSIYNRAKYSNNTTLRSLQEINQNNIDLEHYHPHNFLSKKFRENPELLSRKSPNTERNLQAQANLKKKFMLNKNTMNMESYFDIVEKITGITNNLNMGLSKFFVKTQEILKNETNFNTFSSLKDLLTKEFDNKFNILKSLFENDLSFHYLLEEFNELLVDHIAVIFDQRFKMTEGYVKSMDKLNEEIMALLEKYNKDFFGENVLNFNNFYNKVYNDINDHLGILHTNLLDYHNKNLGILKDGILDYLKTIAKNAVKDALLGITEPNILNITEAILDFTSIKESFTQKIDAQIDASLDKVVNMIDQTTIKQKIEKFVDTSFLPRTKEIFGSISLLNFKVNQKFLNLDERYHLKVLSRNNSDVKEFNDTSMILHDELIKLFKSYANLTSIEMNSLIIDLPNPDNENTAYFNSEYITKIPKLLGFQFSSIERRIKTEIKDAFNISIAGAKNNFNKLVCKLDNYKINTLVHFITDSYINLQKIFINNNELNTILSAKAGKSFDALFDFLNDKIGNVNGYIEKILEDSKNSTSHIFFMMQLFDVTKFGEYSKSMNLFFSAFTNIYNTYIQERVFKNKNNIESLLVTLQKDILDPDNMFKKELEEIIKNKKIESLFTAIVTENKDFVEKNIITPIKTQIESKFVKTILDAASTALKGLVEKIKKYISDGDSPLGKIYHYFYDIEMFILKYEIMIFEYLNDILDEFDKIVDKFTNMVDVFNKKIDEFIDWINKQIDDRIAEFEKNVIEKYIEPAIIDGVLKPIDNINKEIQAALNEFITMITDKIIDMMEGLKRKENEVNGDMDDGLDGYGDYSNFESEVRKNTKYKYELKVMEDKEVLEFINSGFDTKKQRKYNVNFWKLFEKYKLENDISDFDENAFLRENENNKNLPILSRHLQEKNEAGGPLNLKEIINKITSFNGNLNTVVNIWKNIKGVKQIFDVFHQFMDIYHKGIKEINSRIHKDIDKIKDSVDKLKIENIIQKFKDRVLNVNHFTIDKFPGITHIMQVGKDVLQRFNFDSVKTCLSDNLYRVKREFMELLLNWIGFNKSIYHLGDKYSNNHGVSYFIMLGPVPVTMNFSLGFGFGWNIDFGLAGLDIYAKFTTNANSHLEASAGIGLPLLNFNAYIRGIFAEGNISSGLTLKLFDLNFGYNICFSARFGSIEAGVRFQVKIDLWLFSISWTVNLYGPTTLYAGYQMNNVCPVNAIYGK